MFFRGDFSAEWGIITARDWGLNPTHQAHTFWIFARTNMQIKQHWKQDLQCGSIPLTVSLNTHFSQQRHSMSSPLQLRSSTSNPIVSIFSSAEFVCVCVCVCVCARAAASRS